MTTQHPASTPAGAETAAAPPRPPMLRSLARLVPYARPALPRLIGGALVALAATVVSLMVPLVIQWVIDGPISAGSREAVLWGVGAVFALGLLEALFIFLRRALVLAPATEVDRLVRQAFFERLLRLPVAFHDRWPGGQLLSRMMQDIGRVRRFLSFGLIMLLVNLLTIVIGIGLLFRWHWVLGTLFLVCTVPLWLASVRFNSRFDTLSRLSQDQAGDLATSVEESVHGIRVLKAFGRGGHALDAFARRAESLRGTELRKARALGEIWFWHEIVPVAAQAVCLLAGVWLVVRGELSVGELFAFFTLAAALSWPIGSLGFLFSMLIDTRTSVDRIFEVFGAPITVRDPEHAVDPGRITGRLRFDRVTFRYPDMRPEEPNVIDGLELELEPGETLALVGATGCGKTTLTTLPLRLFDVTGGAVRLDGHDVREMSLETLRSHIGIAFEDPVLFSASVRENVLLGREDLEPGSDKAERVLREALDVAHAGFAYDLPRGLDTEVGEEGLSLSGGQRQRLALARVVAAQPAVLVLDDPLSALDVDTETRVTAELRRVLADTTVLVVAHRPSTVALADRVAVMSRGRIVAVGRHADLLRTSAEYRALLSTLGDEDRGARSSRGRDPGSEGASEDRPSEGASEDRPSEGASEDRPSEGQTGAGAVA
ncbi:ABC transporter ATP-binding protein [Leucobacter triazinivorans]|uniref:ABC transporter ATP-binding protein n=1 Tax=Leucobacter triazinivorans TaxID=1784719 RepID=A0A4P6KFS5_9MICO|nr:ABC transporter ATP-binding protein [Leucobacter triazinivorans]